ncbi:MAG: hypothetical protein JWN50_764 [Parcubacteria group bacterium]|nr:hypothetical protein [Parcubacteria group bacterium]
MGTENSKVILGSVVFYPAVIKNFLKKSHYFMHYDAETEVLRLHANHGNGGEALFEARNVSPESARILAEELGLKRHDEKSNSWGKWNPLLCLYHDGSEDAERVRMETLKLGIPCRVVYDSTFIGLTNQSGLHKPPMWSIESLVKIVGETAQKYEVQLATLP